MPAVFPFAAIRPVTEHLAEVHCAPYDTMSRGEAAAMAEGKPFSFLHVDRPDIHFGEAHDAHGPEVYAKANAEMKRLLAEGAMVQDQGPVFTVYRQTMGGRQQTGLVCTVLADDYRSGVIKRHEFTRPDKEDDRVAHIEATGCQCSPVFLAYRAKAELDALIGAPSTPAEVDLTDDLGVRHELWVVRERARAEAITAGFAAVERLYVADGHHRSAAAARIAEAHQGNRDAQRFLVVIFPHDQLHIMDYNRVVHDLNGLGEADFLSRVSEHFDIGDGGGSPAIEGSVGMYRAGRWSTLTAKPHLLADLKVVDALDVALLQRHVLEPILGIEDPRRSTRISFVGGIRGMDELEARVDARPGSVAFAMFPTPMEALLAVADDDDIMPPKSTWFEPKLRSGLFLNPVLDA
jgi:uncharacterized protein (DUF1015 family)